MRNFFFQEHRKTFNQCICLQHTQKRLSFIKRRTAPTEDTTPGGKPKSRFLMFDEETETAVEKSWGRMSGPQGQSFDAPRMDNRIETVPPGAPVSGNRPVVPSA